MAEPIRVYADTSVFGGAFDVEFEAASLKFFQRVRDGGFTLVVSAVVSDELVDAPPEVRGLFDEMLGFAEVVGTSEAASELARAYLDAGILTEKSVTDALHVANATVNGCSVIVSWNFSHIVHFQKIPLYNAVNTIEGYHHIGIHSPHEVVESSDEE